MSAPGRGRGEAAKIARLEEEGSPPSSSLGQQPSSSLDPGGDRPTRGRGGFRASVEYNTIPHGITTVVAAPEPSSRRVQILSNFIKILPMKAKQILSYRVDFEPNIESTRARRQLFKLAFGSLLQDNYTFDGGFDVRSPIKTPQDVTEKTLPHPTDPKEHLNLKMKRVGEVNWSSFEMMRTYNMNARDILDALGFYKLDRLGSMVHPEFTSQIGANQDMTLVRGYRTSTNVHMGNNILMNLEAVHKIMQRQNVLQFIGRFMRAPNSMETVRSQLVGKLVVTSYKNKRVYRVEDVNFNMNPRSTFEKDGRPVSYIDYFRSQGANIVDTEQPMLLAINNSKKKIEGDKEIYLVPELCNIAGLTEEQRNDNRLKMDMIRTSQVSPADRVLHMNEFLKRLHSTPKVRELLNKWGYDIDKEACKITARQLEPEGVGFGGSKGKEPKYWPKMDQSAGFDGLLMRDKLMEAPVFRKLAILMPRSMSSSVDDINRKLRTAFEKINLTPQSVESCHLQGGESAHNYVQQLKNLSPDTTAAIVMLPNQNKEKYDAIKKQATAERGLITQVITGRLMTDQRKASGAAVKIGIQVAAKIGGEPWHLNVPLKQAMVCGYDTYHDTTNRGRSYGAFVASMNDKYSRWFSKADSHDKLDELSSHLTENFVQALRKYKEINKEYPTRVFIYRDGVSDGQIPHIKEVELEQLKRAMSDLKPIPLTFIIVNKRIGARFYLRNNDQFVNCGPGTVIDDVVTRKERFDFFLISQSTRAGTVSPTYYNIIHDESGFGPSIHQAMAYKFCFLYYNWTGSVRVPAPCQYAHKLALLCGEHLHCIPNASLDDRLHFL